MLIIGIGIDIIEVKRIHEAIKRDAFLNKIFTNEEIAYCESKKAVKAASYAARFAAKEAVGKAFGRGFFLKEGRDIEVLNDLNGAPFVNLKGVFKELAEQKKVVKIHISLTHTKEYAAAQVLLLGGES